MVDETAIFRYDVNVKQKDTLLVCKMHKTDVFVPSIRSGDCFDNHSDRFVYIFWHFQGTGSGWYASLLEDGNTC